MFEGHVAHVQVDAGAPEEESSTNELATSWAYFLAAARRAKTGVIWSKDFNITQDYDEIVAVNPLI